jgi:nucleoside-diphosphate-sugar epimerase
VLKFFQMVRHGVALTVGGWNRQATFLYVQDTVQGLLAAAQASCAVGRTYCLGHPRPVSWKEFAAAAGRALGRQPHLVSIPASVAWGIAAGSELCAYLRRSSAILNREKMREITQRRWVCDPSRAMAELGFDPRYDIERGVLATAQWYQAAGWV